MKLILLGPPGSGKGTLAEKLETKFHLTSISAGEVLREEVNKKTTLGKVIKKYIDRGHLVPDEFITQLILLEIKDKKNYILDGFPRTVEQAKAIAGLHLHTVIYLEIPLTAVVERLAGRMVCGKGTHNYHIIYLPPKKSGICDKDGSKLVQRKDDTPTIVKERFRVYTQKTAPVIKYYQQKGILKTVDASAAPKTVFAEALKILKR